MCRALERRVGCEYPDIMMPGIYLLDHYGFLEKVAETVGFHGDYQADFWEWMQEEAEGFGRNRESNWVKVWRQACDRFSVMKGEM
jgi:hypothetical protein